MPAYSHSNRNLLIPVERITGTLDKANPSPVTPAVTGILYPTTPTYSNTEAESSRYEAVPNRLYSRPNVGGSAIGDDVSESGVLDENHLGNLWGSIRQQKARKMAKERPKVQSLEEIANELSLDNHPVDIPLTDSHQASVPRSLKKRKSM